MIEFITKNTWLYGRKEVWFYDAQEIQLADNTLFYQARQIHPNVSPTNVQKMNTLEINLDLNPEQILSGMKSRLRSYINQAENSGFTCTFHDAFSEELFHNFFTNQRQHARQKKLLAPNSERFLAYMKSNNFLLSTVQLNSKNLAQHFYIHDGSQIRMVTSHHCDGLPADSYEQVALANKFLHWQDILEAKRRALKVYDFGGISLDPDNGIARFKKSFGGEIKSYYNFVTTKGLFALAQSTRYQLKNLSQGSTGEKLT